VAAPKKINNKARTGGGRYLLADKIVGQFNQTPGPQLRKTEKVGENPGTRSRSGGMPVPGTKNNQETKLPVQGKNEETRSKKQNGLGERPGQAHLPAKRAKRVGLQSFMNQPDSRELGEMSKGGRTYKNTQTPKTTPPNKNNRAGHLLSVKERDGDIDQKRR